MSRKARSDSPLKTLPAQRQEAIADYARDHSLEEAVAWLRADGLKTSRSAVSEFLSWHGLRSQLNRNESTVEQMLAQLKSTAPELTSEDLDRAGQMFFTALAIEQRDSMAWKRAQDIRVKDRLISVAERRVTVLEEKIHNAQALIESAKTEGGLTPETLAKIERELKLL